jgi:hypothetical protein
MSSINIDGSYIGRLRNAKPIIQTIKRKTPKGMAALKPIEQELPAVNTDITFSALLPSFEISKERRLAAIDIRRIPEIFDWRHVYPTDDDDILRKKALISKPGNQAMCGSCWAISGAGIIADNFVVSGIVDWVPNLSTTWSLMCYPQGKCNGGNPAQLFNDVSIGGIVSNHCIDYSWCLKNDVCNGNALKHFDNAKKTYELNKLNSLIPSPCGSCYNNDNDHFLYFIDKNPKLISIGSNGIDENNVRDLVKKQIYTKGPVMGGFIVFKNFLKGTFSKTNGGVYFEKANYDDNGDIIDWNNNLEYYGAHAIAIIGWGIAKNIKSGENKIEDVPYWYCRNSWTDKWADGGYFKIAMYPWNKISQFEQIVTINDKKGMKHQAGGIIFVSASKKPIKTTFKDLIKKYNISQKIHDDIYYSSEFLLKPEPLKKKPVYNLVSFIIYFIIIFLLLSTFYIIYKQYIKKY